MENYIREVIKNHTNSLGMVRFCGFDYVPQEIMNAIKNGYITVKDGKLVSKPIGGKS